MDSISKQFTQKIENINSLSHGIGIVFGVVSMPLLIRMANKGGNVGILVGSVVYAASFLFVFISSTVYHALRRSTTKEIMKVVDHISIYFLIAGTYTPIILVYVNNDFGIGLLTALWSMTMAGIFFKLFYTGKYELLSTLLYLFMGWILFIDRSAFFETIPQKVIWLIVAGGCLYSIGVIFYLWQKFTYHHVIWHIFVLAAAICHYAAILLAV